MNTKQTPPSHNEAWGFFGTMEQHAAAAWPLAFAAVSAATDAEPDAVRAFLDSRHGRHFADEVLNYLGHGAALPEAIDATIHTWMGWRIGPANSRQFGIPKGLPYLVGWVVHCGMEEELAA